MNELKDLEFLADKSKEMLEKQVDSYRQKKTYAGTVMGITTLFIPFFISGISDAPIVLRWIAIFPIGLIVWAILVLLQVLRTDLLFQFFSVDKFKDLVNSDYETILLFEIGANNDSYRDNENIDRLANKKYNLGVLLTSISFIISISLLLFNTFTVSERKPIEVLIVNNSEMSDKGKEQEKPRVIPTVPPRERGRLNEGVDAPSPVPPPKPVPVKGKD